MSDELPKSWATAPLDLLCQKFRGVSYGREDASSVPKTGFVPILRANNLQNDRLVFDELVWVSADHVSEHQKLRDGDIVIAMSSGSKSVVGKTAQVMQDWQGSFGAFCGVLRPCPEFNSRFVGLFLRTRKYRSTISELAAGSNINNLKNEHLAAIAVPLAPLAEQRRIVAKLETLLGKVDASQQRLAKIPVLLKRFRQSVLAAACSGRLTADWREENPTSGINPTEDSAEGFVDLPESWQWRKIGNLFTVETGTTPPKKQPENYSPTPSDCPFFKPTDLDAGAVVREAREWLSEQGEECARLLPALTVCVTSIGATIGKTGLLRVRGATNQQINSILPTEEVLPQFAFYFCCSAYFQRRVVEESSSTTLPIINKSRFKELEFPLPPLPEQHEIVRRVEGLFALADHLEARLAKARGQVEKLTPSLLARAFAGQLVPQDPTDEPAEKLLERIHQ